MFTECQSFLLTTGSDKQNTIIHCLKTKTNQKNLEFALIRFIQVRKNLLGIASNRFFQVDKNVTAIKTAENG